MDLKVSVPLGASLGFATDFDRAAASPSSIANGAETPTPSVTIVPRLQTTTGIANWWFFVLGLTNARGKTPSFSINWANNHGGDPDPATGYRPWYCYRRDFEQWHKFDTAAFSAGVLTFSNNTPFYWDDVIVSYLPFWGVEEHDRWLTTLKSSSLCTAAPGADAVTWQIGVVPGQTDDLGRSLPAQPMHGFEIRDPGAAPTKTCVITAGIHAGEDMGNYVCKYMVDYLLNGDGRSVLDDWRFYVYPLQNPVGRYGGHYRGQWDPIGIEEDPNRLNSPTLASEAIAKAALNAACTLHAPDVSYLCHTYIAPLFSYYDRGSSAATLAAAIDQVSGLTHYRHGIAFLNSEAQYLESTWGCPANRVIEVGQEVVTSLDEMRDLAKWHIEALRLM